LNIEKEARDKYIKILEDQIFVSANVLENNPYISKIISKATLDLSKRLDEYF
jgi:hypothetical protein